MYHLEPTQPYSFASSLKRLQDLPGQIVYRVEGDPPTYTRALDQNGRLGLIRIAAQGTGLGVTLEGDLEAADVLSRVTRAFSLDLDLPAFQRHMEAADPIMAGLARKYAGARPIAAFSLWEALAFSMIAQQITMSFAFTLKASLVSLAGRAYGPYPAFPGPEAVAALRYEDLQAHKYSRRKAEYVIDTARAIVTGALDLEAVTALPFDQAVQELVKVRGVGRWTAECLLMDAGAPDAFPAGDIGIRNAVQRFYGLDHQPLESEVRDMGRAWAPYSSLACFYLWLGLLDKG